jgi:hypothetical protein
MPHTLAMKAPIAKGLLCGRQDSTTSSPTKPHPKTDARDNCYSQPLAVGNRNEAGRLITYFYYSHGNSPRSSTTTPAFAPRTASANTPSTRPRSVAIHYSGNRDDRFSLGNNWFAVDGFHIRLAENAFLQRLQKS